MAARPETRACRRQRRGRIRGLTAYADPVNGNTVLRYLSDIPPAWIRAELAAEKYRGTQTQMEV